MKLYHREIGEGQPLIILHGLFGSSDNWLSIGKRLENDFKVYLVDQRNHGQSEHSEEWDYTAMADDLAAFIEEQQIEDPIIMGHSMGGKTVMEFAFQYAEIPQKLIVVDIAPRPYPVHHHAILEGLNAIDIENLKSRKAADNALSEFVPEMGVRQFLLKNIYRNSKTGKFSWRINLPVITQKIENVGEDIRSMVPFEKPILFLGGANSEYIREEDKNDIKRLFPSAQIEMIPNAGHWVHAEQPDAFLKAVQHFLG